jgi:hypothetical protein
MAERGDLGEIEEQGPWEREDEGEAREEEAPEAPPKSDEAPWSE